VKNSRFSLVVLSVVLASPLARSQQPDPQQTQPMPDLSRSQRQPVGRIEAAKHQLQLDPPIGPQTQKFDQTKLHQEADELSKLAQSLPLDIDQLAQGKLPKDLDDKLKRIEKLSKRLRNALTQ